MHTLTLPPSGPTPGLLLRPWIEEDAPAMVVAHRDPNAQRWWRNRAKTTEEALRIIRARQASARAGTGYGFAVLLVDDDGTPGDLVGGLSLRQLGDESVAGEVGYWVAARARGQGIAPRALNAACEWVFSLPRPRPLEGLQLIHAVGNVASCRVAVKAGFKLSAILPPQLPDFPHDGHLHIRSRGQEASPFQLGVTNGRSEPV
jgi:RimJ/RimL family protein N-acetyltransferase